ncbi:MAG: alpha/beta fold hydrolase [Gammaproteobacteria bacterium]|nr:alpha/beta fold hydrolase [Gammaproteobacteria bacterium]
MKLLRWKQTIVAFVTVLVISEVNAVELKPRGMLGLMGEQTVSEQGMLVERVAPNSTAAKLGILQGDRVVKLNQKNIKAFSDLITLMSPMRADEKIELVVQRGDKTLTLSGTLQARPQESSTDFNVIADVVTVGNDHLRSYIYQPNDLAKDEQRPAVFYIQGYTCGSVDWGAFPNLTIRQLFADLARAGYVVYRVEKFGVGDSIGPRQCMEIDFTTELSGFNAALKELKALPYVDAENVHIFGHSLGGLYAPLVAKQSSVKSVMVYGTVVKPWHDYLLDIYAEQALLFGTSVEQAKQNRDTIAPLLQAWLKTDRSLASLRADPKLEAGFASNLIPINNDEFFHRHFSFFRDQNQYDFAAAWQQLNRPALAIHGEYDIQAINDKWTFEIVNAVNHAGKNLAERVVIPKTEHSLMNYPSREALMTAMSERQHSAVNPGEHYNNATLTVVLDWLAKHSKS